MQLFYNGVDITNSINVLTAIANDRAGGLADDIDLVFSDIGKNWTKWDVKKGDEINIIEGTYSTGIMFVDEVRLYNGTFRVKCKSLPLCAKTVKYNCWENIRLHQLINTIGLDLGLKVKIYDVADYLYKRVEQVGINSIKFLSNICLKEGYRVKVTNKALVVYNERVFEGYKAVQSIYDDDIYSNYEFISKSLDIYSSCKIQYLTQNDELIKHISVDNTVVGSQLIIDTICSSLAEAERYSINLLRNKNKYEITTKFNMLLNTNLAATSIVDIKSFGSYNGLYFIENISHNFIDGISSIFARKLRL